MPIANILDHSIPVVYGVDAASQQTLLLSQSSPSYSMCLKGNLDPSTPLMLLLDHGMHMVNILDLSTPM